MSRTAFTNRSVRAAARTATFGLAAMLALGACDSGNQAGPAPAGSRPSGTPAATAAPAAASPAAASPVAATPASTTRSPARASAPGAGLRYVEIVEPFGRPGPCQADGTTVEMTACILHEVVEVDYTVDGLQRQRFAYSTSAAERKADLRDDARWLAGRTKTCSKNLTGGSMDQLNEAQCLLDVSKSRVESLS